MNDDRGELRRVERNVVRVVVLDAVNHVLLLQTRDLGNPTFGTSWELPGGGTESGETHVDAAVRELREGTGIKVEPARIGKPTWRRDVEYTYRGERRLQHELVVIVRLDEAAPDVEDSQRVDYESVDHFGYRWWAVDEIVCSDQQFYPAVCLRCCARSWPETRSQSRLSGGPEIAARRAGSGKLSKTVVSIQELG
jgi:8-oxo-dGTP pyrophosphatase MutT (NUDIX family)